MEDRVRRLQEDMSEVRSNLKAIREEIAGFRKDAAGEFASLRTDVAYLRGRIENLPTALQLLGFSVAVFLAAGVLQLFQS